MMKNTLAIILIFCCVWSLQAQENIPVRPYGPDEVVSLNPNLPFNTALEILNGFSQKLENRLIIASKSHTNPIGVSVENMHWKRALEYVLRSNMMKYIQHDRYYAVEEALAQQQQEPEAREAEITLGTREIEINAVFFQADYATLQELGIDWSTFKNGTVQIFTLGASSVVQQFLKVSGGGTISGRIRVDALLNAFESRSKGEILARPQIRVMDGQKGKIKVGKNFYLTLSDFAGNTRFTEYEAGVILTVTPTAIGRNDSTFIHLEILAERSDVQPDDIGITKSITEGQTRVLLLNGEETVLAGLLSHEATSVRKGVPLLKDLPLLRYLFSYNSRLIKKKELVILIQSEIVPGLLNRKSTQIDVNQYLDQQRRSFNKIMSPNDKNGAKESSTRGARRNTPSKP
jgi:type IV pilus assembly protein PilQ